MEFRTERKDIALELTRILYDKTTMAVASREEHRKDVAETYKAMFRAVAEASKESGEKPGVA